MRSPTPAAGRDTGEGLVMLERTVPAPAERILSLIRSGQARSRRELCDLLGASPSTVSHHVKALIADGLLEEGDAGESSGGRPPRELRVVDADEYLAAIDLGGGHARIGILRRGGRPVAVSERPVDLREGAARVVTDVAAAVRDLLAEHSRDGRVVAAAMALPGPVDVGRRTVLSPSRMPGWQGHDVVASLTAELQAPAVVENDANAMALGEAYARENRADHSITVKAGSAIGSGVLVNGQIYRGALGAAGDITHTRVSAAGDTPCTCGNRGCLETVAAGAHLVRILREQGSDVESTADVVALARDADPLAMATIRGAGRHLGEVLSTVVNFFNPQAVYVGGSLAALEPFVSSVRSQIYEGAHPLMTSELVIEPTILGADATIAGLAQLLEQEGLAKTSPDRARRATVTRT